MSRETTDTTNRYGNRELPDGKRTWRVVGVSKKTKNDVPLYIWKVECAAEEIQGEQVLLPSMMGALLRVLGCKEVEKNKFDWDTDDVAGMSFVATVSHEADKKDPTKIRQQMKDFMKVENAESEIPF